MVDYILGKVNTTYSLWKVETDETTKTKTFIREKVVARSLEKTRVSYPDLAIDDTLQGTQLTRTYTDLNDLTTYTEVKGKKTTTTTKSEKVATTSSDVATEPKKRGRPKKVVEPTTQVDTLAVPKPSPKKAVISNDDDDDDDIDEEFLDKANRVSSKYSEVIGDVNDDDEFEYNEAEFDLDDLTNLDVDSVLNDDVFGDDFDDDMF